MARLMSKSFRPEPLLSFQEARRARRGRMVIPALLGILLCLVLFGLHRAIELALAQLG